MSAPEVAAILGASPGHLDALQAAALAGPPGGWIGAGFVRNAIWDALAGRRPDTASLADIDLVHHDPRQAAEARDLAIEAALRAARPRLPWSVVNQARMHEANGHPPYRDLAEALAHWPETATAVAARLNRGRIEVLAPHGLDDLMGMVARPSPAHARDPAVARRRVTEKGWAARWPGLRLVGLETG
jgi:hypothetical protein